jgi:NADH-quinone oxidoreductase subunit F
MQLAGEPNQVVAPATAEAVVTALDGGPVPPPPAVEVSAPQVAAGAGAGGLRLLRRVGLVDPESIDDYRAHGGYAALRTAFELGPASVLREVADSSLLGRGGAAFPAGIKWEAVASAPARPHYVICNADESEPGTFKDRLLAEADPFAVVEAITVAGYAVGAERGYVYVRGEYPLAERRLAGALDAARRRGLLGAGVLGHAWSFDIEVRRGAGAYICGEETALMNSIEGYRGEPRSKPPFPTEVGLFGKPTLVNNVDTLCAVLDVLVSGGPAFARTGTEQSTGTKLFCVSGAVRSPGVYEVGFGASVEDLLDLAGGVPGGANLRAVLLGGAAGMFVAPDRLDLPLTFEATRAAGLALGSGVVIAIDDRSDVAALVRRIAAFFRDESCGQCVPCRVGTVRQEESLHRLVRADGPGGAAGERALLAELGQVMRDASICGLGQTASSAVSSALALGLLDRREGEH